jgi:hypothetical protein
LRKERDRQTLAQLNKNTDGMTRGKSATQLWENEDRGRRRRQNLARGDAPAGDESEARTDQKSNPDGAVAGENQEHRRRLAARFRRSIGRETRAAAVVGKTRTHPDGGAEPLRSERKIATAARFESRRVLRSLVRLTEIWNWAGPYSAIGTPGWRW